MNVIRPVTLTPEKIVSSTLPETEYAAWDSGTSYSQGNRRIYQNYIYESLTNSNVGHTPGEVGPTTYWNRVSPTNYWAMFDSAMSTKSVATGDTITVVIEPGQVVDSVFLGDVVGTEAQVSMDYLGDTVFDQTINLNKTVVYSWKTYFFEPFAFLTQKTIYGLPLYRGATITIRITNALGIASVGSIVCGTVLYLGEVKKGVQSGIKSYSQQKANEFGVLELTKRVTAKTSNVKLLVQTPYFNYLHNLLSALDAVPAVWDGVPQMNQLFAPLTFLGVYQSMSIDVDGLDVCECSLQLLQTS